MSTHKKIVVDTNILFSALLKDESFFTKAIADSEHSFFICESTIVELFKHKERIVQLSGLSEAAVVRLFYTLLRQVTIVKEELVAKELREEAYQLCAEVDVDDTPHVALTLHLNGLLWTGDRKLKRGLRQRGFEQFFEVGPQDGGS